MYTYLHDDLAETLWQILKAHLGSEALKWLAQQREGMRTDQSGRVFSIAFVAAPRKTGKGAVTATSDQVAALFSSRQGFSVEGWSAEQLSRAWLIVTLDASDPGPYVATIENLFLTGEMNELVALYSALPLFAYPDRWVRRCAEGIRSNIGKVLEAVMCRNPYPAENLDEAAWNQLVLKAIFTDKPLLEIYGLRERSNADLAKSISDFAHERWAAHRQVNPLVWICLENYVNETNIRDIERLAFSTESLEQKAAALVCSASSYAPAKALLGKNHALMQMIEKEGLTWSTLARDLASGRD